MADIRHTYTGLALKYLAIMPEHFILQIYGSYLKPWQNVGVRLQVSTMIWPEKCAIIGQILRRQETPTVWTMTVGPMPQWQACDKNGYHVMCFGDVITSDDRPVDDLMRFELERLKRGAASGKNGGCG